MAVVEVDVDVVWRGRAQGGAVVFEQEPETWVWSWAENGAAAGADGEQSDTAETKPAEEEEAEDPEVSACSSPADLWSAYLIHLMMHMSEIQVIHC